MRLRDIKRPLSEDISQADIDNIVQYASQRVFSSEEEAREFVASKDQAGQPWNFGVDEGYWTKMSKVIPVYQTARGWKLGSVKDIKRIKQQQYRRRNPPFSWKNVTLIEPDFTTMRSMGFIDSESKITGPKMVSMDSLSLTERDQHTSDVKEVMQWIKESGEFKPLVIEESGAIIDGHHRYLALKMMKVKRVPVYVVVRSS